MLPWISLLRPVQWLKNLMVFFPSFLSGSLLHHGLSWQMPLPFAAFCCAASAGYIFNDLIDRPCDSQHPAKKNRPLPSGQISPSLAIMACALLCGLAVGLSLFISKIFLQFIFIYLLVMTCYTLFLKDIAILDVFCISLGFVLRLYAGGEAFRVEISDWLFLTVFLLAVFLSVGKRYSERRMLGLGAGSHRRTLEEYPDGFLDGAMYFSGSAVLVTYAMYAISHPGMVYTVPLCMFGLLRYLMRIKRGGSGDPTDSLLRDFPLLVTGVIWSIFVGWSIYH
jgi:4-hydroxybenzoate polyprenyltransferase